MLVKEFAFVLIRVDPDSALHSDLVTYKEKEGKDHILLNFTYRVSIGRQKPCTGEGNPVT